ncbi:MerR family transcriptional regulator [Actinoplanes sp. NPDC023936]|uniref:MerR family transcriptional regulator n=1 Tax=Actinoplanes sp. NPDC023936 TaxID=3154910 RepID=UPI0033D5271A
MRIGELAAHTGASIRSLRHYEEQELLRSTRTKGGQRHYTEDEISRVLLLRRLYAAGLTSQTIRALLPCLQSPAVTNSDAAHARLIHERDRLAAHIADLAHTLDALDGLIAANRADRALQVVSEASGDHNGEEVAGVAGHVRENGGAVSSSARRAGTGG